MSETPANKKIKKERTIKSETNKVFLVVFFILATVGGFTILSTLNGANTFSSIRGVYLKQFEAAEAMKQRSLDLVALAYLLAGDHDLDLLMTELQRYDTLISEYDKSRLGFEQLVLQSDPTPEREEMLKLLKQIKESFDLMTLSSREMTFAAMEGRKDLSKAAFSRLYPAIASFKERVDALQTIVSTTLFKKADIAQSLLTSTSYAGIAVTFLAIFITIGLIWYLIKFLSVSLLPISNLMHNLRQAVFSVDKSGTIISPASRYSATVFDQEIVGQSVFDIVYRDLDKTSEALAGAKTAMVSVFGEDDVQWMLQEDCLPKQVRRILRGNEKFLKLTYTPLWDKQKHLQNIMVVAEDVTEVESLRAMALKRQGEVAIIQGLVGIDRSDLESYLTDASRMLRESMVLAAKMEESADARAVLFRHLHTLKGNSRLYNLTTISEVVHVTEGAVVEINQRIEAKDAVPSELKTSLVAGLTQIDHTLSVHSKMAHKLFGLRDASLDGKFELLNVQLASLEFLSQPTQRSYEDTVISQSRIKDLVPYRYRAALGELPHVIQAAAETAQYLEATELKDTIEALATIAPADAQARRAAILKIQNAYHAVLAQNGRLGRYDIDFDRWIAILKKLAEVRDAVVSLAHATNDRRPKIETEILAFVSLIDADGTAYLRAQSYLLLLQWGSTPMEHEKLARIIDEMWIYVSLVMAIDTAFGMDAANRSALYQILKTDNTTVDELNQALSAVSNQKSIFLSLLRASARDGVMPQQALRGASNNPNCGFQTLSNLICGDVLSREALLGLIAQLAHETGPSADLFSCGSLVLADYFASIQCLGVALADLRKILVPFGDKGAQDGSGANEQTIEISAERFNRIRSLAAELATTADEQSSIATLNESIQTIFDYPLKSLCGKMGAMVMDLSRRLDKSVDYRIVGEDIGVERERAYALRDAMVHLLRNCMDHGIETIEERVKAGKDGRATIQAAISRSNGFVEMRIKDDGRGIDVERVVAKAIEMGALTAEAAQKLSEAERLNLIFLSRLSTKTEVSAISGRGVGMDAVKGVVEETLGGQVSVTSTIGAGTEFCLTIPLRGGQVTQLKAA